MSDNSEGSTRPEKLTVEFHERADAIGIVKRGAVDGPGGCTLLFLLVWFIGMAFGLAALLFKAITDPTLWVFLFALPVSAAWLAVAGILGWMIFGKEALFLGEDEIVFFRKAIIRFSSRVVPRQEVHVFRECITVSRGRHNTEVNYPGIEMVTLGKPVQFCFGLPDEERAWLLHQLNRFLKTRELNGRPHISPTSVIENTAPRIDPTSPDGMSAVKETLTIDRTMADPPTDCDWRVAESADGFEFRQRGHLNIGNLAAGLLLNGAWNGLVWVCVLALCEMIPGNKAPPLQGGQWWVVFLLLIPFEFFGLFMLALLMFAVLEPFRRTAWHFECARIMHRTCWPVYCRRREWEILNPVRVELRRKIKNSDYQGVFRTVVGAMEMLRNPNVESSFDLAFVSCDNVDLCKIENLSEGEVRWMARTILERCASWIGKAER